MTYQALGRAQEAWPYYVRRAEMCPNDFLVNLWTARVATFDTKPAQAEPYVARARGRVPAEGDNAQPEDVLWLQFFPAYGAWLAQDVGQVQAEVDRAEKTAEVRQLEALTYASAMFYLTLGRFNKPAGGSKRIQDWRLGLKAEP